MQNKRGYKLINYKSESTLLYEFKKNFYIIQNGQQGVSLNPAHGSEQHATESIKLYAKLAVECKENELGTKILDALDAFDTEAPEFEPWENKIIAQHRKAWFSARSQKDIEVNSRRVLVIRRLDQGGTYRIIPFDSFNLNPWCGPIEGQDILLPPGAAAIEIGKALRQAFTIATHHPDYVAPKP
jgi:hypothetical protein